ncbi:hypothetical protein BDFG_04406 [Blastomyces dermatitidis ATCC 26199]|nr:hypothetical protein BDFG_04406 [Blastomyces dermatitidis ATCC 26199]
MDVHVTLAPPVRLSSVAMACRVAGRHSTFSTRHAERTLNTAIYLNVMAFGTETEKIAFRNFVTTTLKPVNDNKTNQSYDAMDPQLQLWIAVVAYVTMIAKYETIVGPFSEEERDQVYQQFSIFPHRPSSPTIHVAGKRLSFQTRRKNCLPMLRTQEHVVVKSSIDVSSLPETGQDMAEGLSPLADEAEVLEERAGAKWKAVSGSFSGKKDKKNVKIES